MAAAQGPEGAGGMQEFLQPVSCGVAPWRSTSSRARIFKGTEIGHVTSKGHTCLT